MPRPAHNFTPDDIDVLRRCVAGDITLTTCAVIIGTSRDSCIYRMQRDGLGLPPNSLKARKAREMKQDVPPPTLRPADGWVAVAHKSDRKWVPLAGAPLTISEAAMLREAGLAETAQRRVDGGFDLEVRMRERRQR